MIYRAGWIEKNMGVSRKALRVYEAKGLIHPSKNARNNKYREYTMDDLIAIWNIKLLRELGFSLDQIRNHLQDRDFVVSEAMSERVGSLKEEIERLRQRLELAEAILEAGCLPEIPPMGSVTHEAYIASIILGDKDNIEILQKEEN